MFPMLITVSSLLDTRRILIQYLGHLTRIVTNITDRCANKVAYYDS